MLGDGRCVELFEIVAAEALELLITKSGGLTRQLLQLVRDRVWEEADSESKTAAYATLYHVLREVGVTHSRPIVLGGDAN